MLIFQTRVKFCRHNTMKYDQKKAISTYTSSSSYQVIYIVHCILQCSTVIRESVLVHIRLQFYSFPRDITSHQYTLTVYSNMTPKMRSFFCRKLECNKSYNDVESSFNIITVCSKKFYYITSTVLEAQIKQQFITKVKQFQY